MLASTNTSRVLADRARTRGYPDRTLTGHRNAQNGDSGQATAFVVVWLLAAMLLSGLVFDGGMAVATKVSAVSVAQAAARAGARELDVTALRTTGLVRLDPVRAEAAARDWLTRSGLDGTWTVTVEANRVTVTITSGQPTQLLHLAGIDRIPLHASAEADAISP